VVDLPVAAGEVDRTIGRVGQPSGLAIGSDHVWVADAFDKTVTLIDSASGEATATIDDLMARRIAYGLGSAWVSDDIADAVRRLDAQSGEIAVTIQLDPGTYPTGIAVGIDSLWVANAGTSTVTRIDPASMSVTAGAIPLRYAPESITAGAADVWVASRGSDYVMRIDPQTNSVVGSISVCDEPAAVAADGETVWIACAGSHEVWHMNREGTALSKTNVGGVATDLALANGRVFVTVRQ
jgi:YVTN family beta-propeller protein